MNLAVELRLLDHFKLSRELTRNFACSYSEDNRFFIITDTGIYILSHNGSVTEPFPTFSCRKFFLCVSDFTPSAHVDIDINSFHYQLDRKNLYETLMSTEYSADLKSAKPIEPVPICAEWSPRGIAGKTDCLLAVLSNLYSLEIYLKYLNANEMVDYSVILNVTKHVIEEEKSKWKYAKRFAAAIKLVEYKKRVDAITPTAFTWTHLFQIEGKNACAIILGHLNGDITVWRIMEVSVVTKDNTSLHFLGRYSTQLNRITMMHWNPSTEYGGGLSFADIEGKMSIVHVKTLEQDTANIDKELAFWTEQDKITIDKITVMVYDGYTFIIMVKHTVLIIFGINENGEVFDQKIVHIENYYITGIYHYHNVLLVLSLSGIFTQITISVDNNLIQLDKKNIPLKVDMKAYRTHGFFFTKNLVLFGMLCYPWEMQSFSSSRTNVNVFIYHNNLLNPFELLWNNESGSLRDYWDCFEALRLICLKEKRFPWLGLPHDLNYDDLSLLQLKTLRLVSKLSEMVFNSVPIVKRYHIKPYILIHYLVEIKLIVKRMTKMLNMINSGKELTLFQMRSMDIQNLFLKEMVLRNILPKANVGKNFVKEIRSVMEIANELKYPEMVQCMWCGEKLVGPVCLPPHADSRCSISMMPIFLTPAYKCPFCQSLADKAIEEEQIVIFCGYCDIPMEKIAIDQTIAEGASFQVDSSEEVKSVCFEDCLKETINFDDIQENTNEYVIFSDSDSDGDEDGMLRRLYTKLVSLDDILKLDSHVGGKKDITTGPR